MNRGVVVAVLAIIFCYFFNSKGVFRDAKLWTPPKRDSRSSSDKYCGVVDQGQYAYFRLDAPGRWMVTVWNITGDPDIYISDVIQHPTFDLENHCASAAKPGDDSIIIPRWFGRPTTIAIYGHPSFDQSVYCVGASKVAELSLDEHEEGVAEEEVDPRKPVLSPVDGVAHVVKEFEINPVGTGMLRFALEHLMESLLLL